MTLAAALLLAGTGAEPALASSHFTDYDTDDNGLIEITTLAQLMAMDSDPDGNGIPQQLSWWEGDEVATYNDVFPGRKSFAPGVNGCPAAGCTGYELMNDLDFDTNDDGQVNNDDDFPNPRPFGIQNGFYWAATFDGNGHTIANYRQNTSVLQSFAGFFGRVTGGAIRNVGLKDADVTSNVNNVQIGALVGSTTGASVQNCWSTGRVRATDTSDTTKYAGGLIGFSNQPVQNSWSRATVSLTANPRTDAAAGGLVGNARGSITASYATGAVSGGGAAGSDRSHIGGLVGHLEGGGISASYATGAVSSTSANNAGGLVGRQHSSASITASYATGAVTAGSSASIGGLVGSSAGAINNSYWDVTASGIADGNPATSPGEGKSTGDLQEPAGYSETIYADWNVDVDGQAGADDPWDFGNFCQYPALKYGGHLVSRQRAVTMDDDFPDNDVIVYSGQMAVLTAGNRGGTAYLWEQITDGAAHTVTLSGSDTAQAAFMAPAGLDDAVDLNFRLTLLAGGACATDLVKVTILPAQPNELISLTVTAGGNDLPLTPPFASSRRSFDTYVGAYTGRAEIVMMPAEDAATISFNGDDPVAGARTETVSLAEGHNRFTITVNPPPADGDDAAADDAEPLEPVTYHLNIRRQRTPKLAFDPPQYLLMDEGETATYTVELDTRWLGAEVIINISSDNPDITVAPDTVSISQYDWSERTITVTAADDADGEDDYATIRHIANGGHYNNVGGRLRVEVSDDDTVAPTPTPGPTPTPTPEPTPVPGLPTVANTFTTTVPVDGQTVTITREAGSLTGVTLAYPATLTRNLQVTIAALLDGIPLSSERFGLGTTGVTLTVVGVPAGGLEICLPLSDALVSEAGSRPLTLVRYGGGGWQGLPGAERRGMSVCAARVSTGLFAAAYALPQLGPASDLTVAAGDAAGTLVLRWTPGNDATRHWIAGIKQSDLDAGDMSSSLIWTAASGSNTHTVSGLDSGAEYVFAVAAGRGDEWSGWTALARGTPE